MPRIIKNQQQYEEVLDRISEIFDAEVNTPEGDELELLTLLVGKYESLLA